jgi:hypothetical protein
MHNSPREESQVHSGTGCAPGFSDCVSQETLPLPYPKQDRAMLHQLDPVCLVIVVILPACKNMHNKSIHNCILHYYACILLDIAASSSEQVQFYFSDRLCTLRTA